MTKKKRYTYDEVKRMMKNKYGDNAPHIHRTTNYEPDLRYRVDDKFIHYQTLNQIVDAYKLEE